jgi:hypothetical protein
MLKDYNKIDELDQETLASDMEFIQDASIFLSERGGYNQDMTPVQVYEAFMEHMRYQDVNEVTAIRDLEYAQNANLEGKQRFGRLIDAYDKVNEDISGRMLWDYASGVLTAPSTYIGIATGGTGKAAAVAGTQAARFGIRKILSGALKAAAVEGAIGAGQGAVQEATRVETDIQSEFTGGRTLAAGLSSAAVGGLINLPVGALQVRQANRANELYESAKLAEAEMATQAATVSKRVLNKADKTRVNKIRNELNELDPAKVAEGRRIKKDLMPTDTMEAAIGAEAMDNITAAAIRIIDRLEVEPNERITSALHRMLDEPNGFEKLDDIRDILGQHNITMDQFSLVFLAEVSDAGRTLGSMSRLRKVKGRSVQTEVGKLLDEVDRLHNSGASGLNAEDVLEFNKHKNVATLIKDMDSLRLGSMTAQLMTTMRNNLNGGMRIAVDATTRMFDNAVNLRNPFDGTFDLAKYAMNPYEAKVIERLMREQFPEEAAKLFRQAADLAAADGSETVLGRIGRKINFANTASDNFFKRAMITASLKRRLGDVRTDEAPNGIDLYEVIAKGEFGRIPDQILKDAIQDAYEFTYQSAMRTGPDAGMFERFAGNVIKAHRDYPFLVSVLLPFPRYIANQTKFVYEHAPLIGLLPIDRIGSKLPARTTKEYFKEKAPKQLTGAAMMLAAYEWRVMQGDDAAWYEFKDGNGNYVDGRAVYGPFAPFMLAADLIYRYNRGTMPTSIDQYVKDGLQAMLGSTFRAGLGLYALDKFYQDAREGQGEKIVAELIGNIAATYTLPVAVVKDFYGQFDPRSRDIPESRPGEDETVDINFLDLVYRRATRSLPDFPLNGYDQPMISATKTGTVRAINPLEKQIFGFGKRGKNEFEKEITRLGFTPYEIYRRDKNEVLDLYMRQELSRDGGGLNLEQKMTKFIEGEAYRNMSLEQRRVEFSNKAREIINDARKMSKDRMDRDASRKDRPYSERELQDWVDTPELVSQAVKKEYEDITGRTSLIDDRELTMQLPNGDRVNTIKWALSAAKRLQGGTQ